MLSDLRVIICPGNGCTSDIQYCNWYGFAANKLQTSGLFKEVLCEVMPDPIDAKETIWVPHLLNSMKADSKTIIIGHSSGAEACMRLLESNHLFGAVLVSACYTDLGEPSETISGYYNRPWLWEEIKKNVDSTFGIIQVHSKDDPFIPVSEAEHVAQNLQSEFFLFNDRSHFFTSESIDSILDMIMTKIRQLQYI